MEEFLRNYSLTVEEKEILSQRPILENGDDSFFRVLNRANEIKDRCTSLMQDPYCMMTATLELLETVSKDEENGYHRLFSWCQNECRLTGDRSYSLDSGNENFLRLRRGLRTLQNKETYFNHCITEFVNNRRNLLTLYLSENLPKWRQARPDDNPNQVISDLFTWLHEYMNEEKEGVRMLLLGQNVMEMTPPKNAQGNGTNLITSCMDVIFSGANKFVQEFLIPFFEDSTNLPQLFEVMQILSFYESIVQSIISPESSLRSTLLSIEQTLWNRITSLFVTRVKHYFKLSPFVSSSFVGGGMEGKNSTTGLIGQNSIFTELLLLMRQCFDM